MHRSRSRSIFLSVFTLAADLFATSSMEPLPGSGADAATVVVPLDAALQVPYGSFN
jgi:hypothetical protein